MSNNGETSLVWERAVLTSSDLRSLNGHRRLVISPRTIITPLARDEIRERAIEIEHPQHDTDAAWGVAMERDYPFVESAIQSLRRDGISLRRLTSTEKPECRWSKALTECISRGECQGGVIFSSNPGLFCCVANKLAGIRAIAVRTINCAALGMLTMKANCLAVEMPGRTWHEIKQILRLACEAGSDACPQELAETLRELES